MNTIRLIVPDMDCDGCVHAVTKAVQSIDPQARVDIALAAKTVDIASAARRDALAEAIRGAGFTVAATNP